MSIKMEEFGSTCRPLSSGERIARGAAFACMPGGDDRRTHFACVSPTIEETEAAHTTVRPSS
jgi:hypothetical protein